MILKKWMLLLILTLLISTIRCKAQSQVISNELNKFYIKAVISEQALKIDTAQLHAELLECDSICNRQLVICNLLEQKGLNEKQVADNYRLQAGVLATKFDKKTKWLKFWRTLAVELFVTVIIETVIIYLAVKKVI